LRFYIDKEFDKKKPNGFSREEVEILIQLAGGNVK